MKPTGIGKRIKQARERKGWTQAELAERIGVTKSAITNYEQNASHPKEQILYSLFEALDVDANFLFQDAVKTTQAALDPEELDLIDDFRSLHSWEQKMIKDLVRSLINGNHSVAEDVVSYRTMTLYSGRPSAGSGNYLPESSDLSKSEIQVIDSAAARKADFVLQVDGDSMEPKFSDYDNILVQKADTVDTGEIGVFLVNGEVYIKQAQQGYLHSLNPDYSDIELSDSDEVICLGKVLGKI